MTKDEIITKLKMRLEIDRIQQDERYMVNINPELYQFMSQSVERQLNGELSVLKEELESYKLVLLNRIAETTATFCSGLDDENMIPIILVFVMQSYLFGMKLALQWMLAKNWITDEMSEQLLQNGEWVNL